MSERSRGRLMAMLISAVMALDLDLSVVVCTRNRSELLSRVCEAIVKIVSRAPGTELVLVDNRSTDDTPKVIRRIKERNPDKVRVVQERRLGLSAARNAGIAAASGQVVVFLDDDAFPGEQWLGAIRTSFDNPDVWCVGGPVEPDFEGELPHWFRGQFLGYLSVWDPGPTPMDLHYNQYPRGTNIAFRRDVFESLGGFSQNLGRKGRSLLSCEEIELCLRIERNEKIIRYSPEARVRHVVSLERLSPAWMVQRYAAQGRSEAIIDWCHGGWQVLRKRSIDLRDFANAARDEQDGTESARLLLRCRKASYRAYLRARLWVPLRYRQRFRPGDQATLGAF